MGRKRQWEDDEDSSDGSSDSNEDLGFAVADDPDSREERALFADPYKRKKQRRGGKEDAMLGVFGDDDDDEGPSSRGPTGKKPKYTK